MTARVRLEPDERRASILAGARRLFCERPYSEVSTADLAEAAGVARGLLHHYFGSKRELYLEVLRDLVRLPTPPPGDVWEASVDGWLALIETNRELWLTAIGAGSAGRDPELRAVIDDAKELLAERVLDALHVPDAERTPAVRAVVRGYGGFAEEVTREWLERGRLSRAQARALLRETMPLLLDLSAAGPGRGGRRAGSRVRP